MRHGDVIYVVIGRKLVKAKVEYVTASLFGWIRLDDHAGVNSGFATHAQEGLTWCTNDERQASALAVTWALS